MLDPLSALGLASNIAQLVEFSSKLISKSREMYSSTTGSTAKHQHLEILYRDFHQLSQNITTSSQPSNNIVGASPQEQALARVAESCKETADELLAIIDSLKVTTGPRRRWRSFRQALKSVRKQEEIDVLQNRLDAISSQLNVHVAAVIRDQQSALMVQLNTLLQEHGRIDSARKEQLEGLVKELRLTQQKPQSSFTQSDLNSIATALSVATVTVSKVPKEYRILDSLRFGALKSRERQVTVAYAKTFDWIFAPTSSTSVPKCLTSKFPEWLRSGTGIFWISGKPGSGKSTLMKYLVTHANTAEHLRAWVGEAKLVTASFFFWNAGNQMQKSQEGLLRSLLYEVLRKCPELTQVTCSNRWDWNDRDFDYNGSWDIVELSETIDQLANQQSISAKFCFFIDGLDEYDGSHSDVVKILDVLTRSPSIKVCVSSRPWNVFEDAYGGHGERRLNLQDLTRSDIEYYARSNLESHVCFNFLSAGEIRCRELIQDITNKSQGVFLWVILVVRSLCEGLTDRDSVLTLKARLDLLPSDLEKYFRHILEGVDGFHRKAMARAFQASLRAKGALHILGFSFLDEPSSDYVMKLATQEFGRNEILSRSTIMSRRLNARCKGLLEVSTEASLAEFWGPRVEFLHRTVRDFLESKEMQSMLNDYIDDDSFNADKSLCRMYLAFIKTMPRIGDNMSNTGVGRDQLDRLLFHARQAEVRLGKTDRKLLDEVEHTLTELAARDQCRILEPVAPKTFENLSQLGSASIFELSVANNLAMYARERLVETPLVSWGRQRLLGYALQLWGAVRYGVYDVKGMVEIVIACGVDLNDNFQGCPIWFRWLQSICTGCHIDKFFYGGRGDIEDDFRVLELLLERGADPNRTFPPDCRTLWRRLLESFYPDSSTSFYVHKIMEILLAHGADPHVVMETKDGETCTVSEIFHQREILPPESASRYRCRMLLEDNPPNVSQPRSIADPIRGSLSN